MGRFKLGQKPGDPVANALNPEHNLITNRGTVNMSAITPSAMQSNKPLMTQNVKPQPPKPDASAIVGTNPREELNKELGLPKTTPPHTTASAMNLIMSGKPTSGHTDETSQKISKIAQSGNFSNILPKSSGSGKDEIDSGTAMNMMPFVGEAMDATNAAMDLSKGDYIGATANAAGFLLPFVPGGVVKTAAKKLFGKGKAPVPAPKPMPTSNPVKEIKEQAEERFAKSRRVYENEPWDDTPIRMELDAMKQTGKKLDAEHGYFDYSQLTPENAKFHGTYSGRPIAEVELPGGGTQMMYKSSGLAGKKGAGVGGTTEGLWQPYGGHANIVGSQGWFIKDAGYKDFYGSESFRNLSGQMDRLAQEGKWDMSQMIQASKNK